MNTLPASPSPLMQPVEYQSQTYFTSQYFHQQYMANSYPEKAKYTRHPDFLRVLRGIEAYALYLRQGDIIEIMWPRMKAEGKQNLLSWQSLFQAAGWNPLTLLNATAQVALSHHLDDELSKQVSVVVNTTVARQMTALDRFPELRAIVELAQSTAEARLLAEEAKAEAAQANANAARALDSQLFFTVAEYVSFNHLQRQIPASAYKACSDHLRLYCMDNAIPFRKIFVGGRQWEDEYGFHVSVYTEAFPDWLKRRYAQAELHLIHTRGKDE